MKADLVYMPVVSTSPWREKWAVDAGRVGEPMLRYITATPWKVEHYLMWLANGGGRKRKDGERVVAPERFDAREDIAWNDYNVDIKYHRKLTVMSRTFIDPQRAIDCVEDNQRHKEFDKFWSARRWGIVGLDLNAVHMKDDGGRRSRWRRKRLREGRPP